MPTVLIKNGYRFFFYVNDHSPGHIHIEKGDGTAKFSLNPVELLKSRGFKANEIAEMRKLVLENVELFTAKWDEYFNHS
ncbi:MAG: DUF4160 domain-containing protein [Lentimicrobium sp.]|nr:DUF4160 domain-containing protein [Lentimicrobium sp.]